MVKVCNLLVMLMLAGNMPLIGMSGEIVPAPVRLPLYILNNPHPLNSSDDPHYVAHNMMVRLNGGDLREGASYRCALTSAGQDELMCILREGTEEAFIAFIAKLADGFNGAEGESVWRNRVAFVDNLAHNNGISLSNFASLFAAYQIDGRLMQEKTNDALDQWIKAGPYTLEGLKTCLTRKQLQDIDRVFREGFLDELCLYVSINHKITGNDHRAVNDSLADLNDVQRDYALRHAHMMPHHTQIRPLLNDLFAMLQNILSGDGVDYIELAEFAHTEFVRIHPLLAANGRVARYLMNEILNAGGYRRIIFEDDYTYSLATQRALADEKPNALVELIRGILSTRSQRCDACFKIPTTSLSHCGRCNGTHYCGRECQIADWRAGHKDECCKKDAGPDK